MAGASVESICRFLRRKYKLPVSDVENVGRVLRKYFDRRKDFDLIIEDGKILVLAKKTPNPTPEH